MAHDYSKLRGRIVEKYRTYKEFSQIVGLAPGVVSDKVNEKSPITHNDIDEWSKALDISLEEIGMYFFTPKV